MVAPTLRKLILERFRGIEAIEWYPAPGVNLILGGGDVGKTTLLEAIGLLLNPSGYTTLSDADYYLRDVEAGFSVEGIFSLPTETGISDQYKTAWPWIWDGQDAVVPEAGSEDQPQGDSVYRLRLRGTPDLEAVHEIVQPDGTAITLSVGLRRAIGLVRLSGDDRNDRDLRLVQGSALDRLLSDRGLRSRMGRELGAGSVKDKLSDDGKTALDSLGEAFGRDSLPTQLDLAVIGGQGLSIAALIGLTAAEQEIAIPLASWGAGTRRLSSLAISRQTQSAVPIITVDEVERGLEPYRQRFLVGRLQETPSQTFMTTHSPTAVSAAASAALWYVDHTGRIGPLDSPEVARQRGNDPETFLARLTIVAEGKTEKGFVTALLERALGSNLEQHGIHVSDGGGHEAALNLMEALAKGRLSFGCFVDDEEKHNTRWSRLSATLGQLAFRWSGGSTEQCIIELLGDDQLEKLLIDPDGEKTGYRLQSLRERLGTAEKDFESLKSAAASRLTAVILEAATGKVPAGKEDDKKHYRAQAKNWFKTEAGGRELSEKVFSLGIWPTLRPSLIPFCNAVRAVVGLPSIEDVEE